MQLINPGLRELAIDALGFLNGRKMEGKGSDACLDQRLKFASLTSFSSHLHPGCPLHLAYRVPKDQNSTFQNTKKLAQPGTFAPGCVTKPGELICSTLLEEDLIFFYFAFWLG